MRTLIVSALTLTAMASAALAGAPEAGKTTPSQATTAAQAGPVKLTASQMDSVTAGFAAGQDFNIPAVLGAVIGATASAAPAGPPGAGQANIQGTACGNQCVAGDIVSDGVFLSFGVQ